MTSKRKRLVFIALVAVAVGGILWSFMRTTFPPPKEKGGEIPFILARFNKEEDKATNISQLTPFEACLEMVMHYWGTPPTEKEEKLLLQQNTLEWSEVHKLLKRHKLSFLPIVYLDKEKIRQILQLGIPIIATANIKWFPSVELPHYTEFLIKQLKDGNLIFNDPRTKADIEMDVDLFFNAYWLTNNNLALLIFPSSKENLLKEIIPPSCFEEYNDLWDLPKPWQENFKGAIIQQLKEKLGKRPNSALLNYLLGWRLSREGEEEGLLFLKKAYEINPLPFYKVEFAIAHCYLGKNKEALRLLNEVLKENPRCIALPSVFFYLCYLLSREGKTEEIKQMFFKASSIAPPHLRASIVEIYCRSFPISKETCREKIKVFQRFFTQYPWMKGLKDFEFDILASLLYEGRFAEAEELLKQAEAEGKMVEKGWFLLIKGLKYVFEGEKEKAEEVLSQMQKDDLMFRAEILKKMDRWAEVREIEPILINKFSPRESDGSERRLMLTATELYHLGDFLYALFRVKDYKNAKKAVEDFLKVYENTVLIGYEGSAACAYAIGGIICYWEGDKGKAKEWLSKAYHNPYFKELDPLLVKDVSKALRELEKTNP